MQYDATTPEEYMTMLPEERKTPFSQLRKIILDNLPAGFDETMEYGMITYVVPHTTYPAGYHVNPKIPLPFISIASQKNFIALYHLGIYADDNLKEWFVNAYPRYSKRKLDMGKSCIRFKRADDIPFAFLGKLVSRMSVQQWVDLYEQSRKGKVR